MTTLEATRLLTAAAQSHPDYQTLRFTIGQAKQMVEALKIQARSYRATYGQMGDDAVDRMVRSEAAQIVNAMVGAKVAASV